MTLSELAIRYGTDKVLSPDGTGNNYTPHYEKFFAPMRDQTINLLENGVLGGASIQMWLEYFPNALIYGVDNAQGTNDWTRIQWGHAPSRYTFVHGDQSSVDFWNGFIHTNFNGIQWDIVIDDGGHFANQVITSFECLWPHVKSGGLYCIEDLACSYNPIYQPHGATTPMDMLKAKLDTMHTFGSDVDSVYFARQLAIIRKR